MDIVTRSRRVALDERALKRRRGQSRDRYSVDLKSHMAECDANYHRLMRLFPDLRERGDRVIALPLAGFATDVEFTVLEKGPYTTLLRIVVTAEERWAQLATDVKLTVRVYHDAHSAEVVSYQNQKRFHGVYEYPNRNMRQRDEKVQINRFLSEFLDICLAHGATDQPVTF